MMTYKLKLISTIQDEQKWPTFDRPDFLGELDALAEEACQQNTLQGYLAALLVYHQLCEEIVKLLVRDSQFYIQLAVFPAEIVFTEKNKLMFGQLLDELDATVSFAGKSELITKCRELNKIRVEIVHRLTKRTSLDKIKREVMRVGKLYISIFRLFDQAHDHFYSCLMDFSKDVDWEDWLKEDGA